MHWELLPARASFAQFAGEWDRLNAELFDGHPYFDSRFIGPLLDYFGDGKERLCVARADGGITGALILKPGGLGRWSLFLPSQAQVGAVLLRDIDALKTLIPMLPGYAWTIDLLALDPRYSPDFSRLLLPMIFSPRSHTIGIQQDNGFDDYWNSRPKHLAKNMRRYFRRAANEFDTPRLAKLTAATDMPVGVAHYGDIESVGWKGTAGTAVSADNVQGAFYAEVMRRFALTSQAAIYELHVADRIAASRLLINSDSMTVILKTAYDESFGRIAPGRLLLFRIIQEELASRHGQTIEFYTNANHDQIAWSTFDLWIVNVQAFRNELIAAAATLIKAWKDSLHSARHGVDSPGGPDNTLPVRSCNDIAAFSVAHNDLKDFVAGNNVEVSIGWFEILQKNVFADDPGARYYVVGGSHSPLLILPVRLTKKGVVRIVESLSNYYTSLYAPLLAPGVEMTSLKGILASATGDHGGADMMQFAPMDPESPAYKGLLSGLRENGWIPFRYFCFGNWFLKVEGDWQWYLKSRSAGQRSNIKRSLTKFTDAGGGLEICDSSANVETALAAFREVYGASWKQAEPFPDFVPSLVRWLAGSGKLRLGVARLNGIAIAAQIWIVCGSRASIFKVGYHEDYAQYSPGTVLTAHLMRRVIEQDRVREVDYLIGDDNYKRFWMSHRRERWGIVAYNPRKIVGFALLLRELSGRMLKALRAKIGEMRREAEREEGTLRK